jgi:hypothetical protein
MLFIISSPSSFNVITLYSIKLLYIFIFMMNLALKDIFIIFMKIEHAKFIEIVEGGIHTQTNISAAI